MAIPLPGTLDGTIKSEHSSSPRSGKLAFVDLTADDSEADDKKILGVLRDQKPRKGHRPDVIEISLLSDEDDEGEKDAEREETEATEESVALRTPTSQDQVATVVLRRDVQMQRGEVSADDGATLAGPSSCTRANEFGRHQGVSLTVAETPSTSRRDLPREALRPEAGERANASRQTGRFSRERSQGRVVDELECVYISDADQFDVDFLLEDPEGHQRSSDEMEWAASSNARSRTRTRQAPRSKQGKQARELLDPHCHQCRRRSTQTLRCRHFAKRRVCPLRYCFKCLSTKYGMNLDDSDSFQCPKCIGVCTCSKCTAKGDAGSTPASASGARCTLSGKTIAQEYKRRLLEEHGYESSAEASDSEDIVDDERLGGGLGTMQASWGNRLNTMLESDSSYEPDVRFNDSGDSLYQILQRNDDEEQDSYDTMAIEAVENEFNHEFESLQALRGASQVEDEGFSNQFAC